MNTQTVIACLVFCGICVLGSQAMAADSPVPEPFRGFDDTSQYTIKYDDLTNVLKTVVVDVGRSTREKAAPSHAATGTRMKTSVKRSTINEGNRFYYETFSNNEEAQALLRGIQKSLEQVPAEVPLKFFSRDEQLAYWLNLYNVTVLNEIIKVYPKRNLKKLMAGKKSIQSKKILDVAGIPLSLDDIQYTILKNNYDSNPLILYGLYQGYIGGPNIRKRAYTGNDVWRALKNNANEFINSNRGTYSQDEKVFRVSSFYERNKAYFSDFTDDLTEHLMDYIEGDERVELRSASKLRANIDDWTVTDLGGTYRDLGASFADNNAALLNAMVGTTPADNNLDITSPGGPTMGAAVGYGSVAVTTKAQTLNRFSPELLMQLKELNIRRENRNAENARVTIEELGEVPVESGTDSEPGKKDNN